jgi:hypothetical protein
MLVTSDCSRIVEEPEAITKAVCPGVWPGAATEVMPGMTSLSHSYLVTLDSMPA